jgi:hypothetical protein
MTAIGCQPAIAAEIAEHLVDADLCGVYSHGIFRLDWYAERAAEGRFVPSAIPSLVTAEGGAEMVRTAIATRLNVVKPGGKVLDLTLKLLPQSVAWLDGVTVAAASAALEKAKHIKEWQNVLEKKALYDPRNLHEADLPREFSRMNAAYFGADPATWETSKLAIMSEYSRFAEEIGRLADDDRKALKPAAFWRSHAATYSTIYKLGLWYASVQTSSVAAERCFGIMRHVEAPNKRAQRTPAWRAELFIRYNKWLADLKWEETLALIPKPDAAPSFAGAGDGAGAFYGPPV